MLLLRLRLLQVFRTRQQLFKSITPDYYGFRDEEDGVLLAVEAEAEAAMQAKVSRGRWVGGEGFEGSGSCAPCCCGARAISQGP